MKGESKKKQLKQLKTIHTIDEKHSELTAYYDKIENETIPQLQRDTDELNTPSKLYEPVK